MNANRSTHSESGQIQDPGLNAKVREQLNGRLHSFVKLLIQNEIDLQFAKKELEFAYMTEVLRLNDGNIGQSAKALRMHRNTLSKRIKELKINSDG